MAIKTTNRKTFSVDYDIDNLNLGFFNFTQYKGLCDTNNDVTVDQNSFSELNNIYVDNNSVLASRSPIKFNDNDIFIADEWHIGDYGLRLYRIRYSGSENYYLYIISCFTHDLFTNDTDKFQAYSFKYVIKDDDDKLEVPKVSLVEIEDKVFIWFAGQAIIVFNIAGEYDSTIGKTLPYFEDAYKYLYIPATTLITNGFESELESKNFLTDSYIERHLYTTESDVEWTKLYGEHVKIYQSSNSDRKELYDTQVDSFTKQLLAYPLLNVGDKSDYVIDTKIVNGIPIVVRTNKALNTVSVSYGTSIFHDLPILNLVFPADKSPAFLTDDGYYVVRFTQAGIAFCQVLSKSSDSTQISFIDNYVWELESYKQWDLMVEEGVITNYVPYGRFHSRTEYLYLFRNVRSDSPDTNWVALHGFVNFKGRNIWVTWDNETHGGKHLLPEISDDIIYTLEFYMPDDIPNVSDIPSGVDINDLGPLLVITHINDNGNVDMDSYQFMRQNITNPSEGRPTEQYIVYSSGNKKSIFGLLSTESMIASNFYPVEYIKIYPTDIETQKSKTRYWNYNVAIANNSILMNTNKKFINIYMTTITVGYFTNESTVQSLMISETAYGGHWQARTNDPTDNINAGCIINNVNSILSGGLLIYDLPTHYSDKEEPGGTYGWDINEHTKELLISAKPLAFDSNTFFVWKDDTIYTNKLQSGIIIEIDNYKNVSYDSDDMIINFRPDVPDCFAVLGDYYISFATITDGKFRLFASDTRRNDNNDFLLYLPERSEQRFSQRITNIHPLADNTMGIFTENEVWYISAINLDNESITRYTKAVKSKLPIGCRMGDEIITADNGQAILFATPRGIAYLTPEDFVATTDRVINYVTNDIQNAYSKFYFDDVINANAYSFGITIPSQIRITKYSYWIFFYRYFDRYIYLLDTRSMTWWKWCTKYPILKIDGSKNLTLLLELEYAYIKPVIDDASIYESNSFCGVSFIYCDKNYEIYDDDIVTEKLNGIGVIDGTYDIKTSVYGDRIVYKFAENTIDWLFMTQKLHFGAINNYKFIRSININTNGMGNLVTKFTTKVYRDLYHPEDNETVEIKINDLRSYVKRYNLMHVTNFTYGLENDTTNTPEQLSINSMSVKYEIKGIIR